MSNRLVRFDDGKDSLEKSGRGCLRYIVKSIVAIVGLHLTMSVFADTYTITIVKRISYPAGGGGGGSAVAPPHEIRTEVVDGVEWTYMTGFPYIEKNSYAQETTYANWVSMNPDGASGLIAVPGYWGVYIGDGTNAAVSASISGHVNVPSVLGECRVIGISANAFSNCTAITSVTVPEEIIKIQESAFTGCSGITEMTLPFVGTQKGNYNVRDANFGVIFGGRPYDGGVGAHQTFPGDTSGKGWFCIPEGLSKLTITDESVLSPHACARMTSLRSVALPTTMRLIGDSAFTDTKLRDIVIPEGVETLENMVFFNCGSLTNVTIASSVRSIGAGAFMRTQLDRIPEMPGVSELSNEMFKLCQSLRNAVIPPGILNIGKDAFIECSALTNVVCGSTVTNIGSGAFYGLAALETVEWSPNLRSIGDSAFSACDNIKSVLLPVGLESIGSSAFSSCSSLENIVIPGTVTNIGNGVFMYSSNLASIIFKGNAPVVGSYVFSCVSPNCIASVPCVSTGWGVSIPGTWNGLRIDYLPFDVTAGEDVVIAPQEGQTFTADDVVRFVGKATSGKGREGQSAAYFKAVGRMAEDGAVLIESVIDEEAVELPVTAKEVLDASMSVVDMTADAPSITLPAESVKEGFYYGVAAAGSIDMLNGLSPELSRASGGALHVSVAKPADEAAGPTKTAAFFKVVICDKQ